MKDSQIATQMVREHLCGDEVTTPDMPDNKRVFDFAGYFGFGLNRG